MEDFNIELQTWVPVYLNLEIKAESQAQAQALADEAVNCLNASPSLTLPDIIGNAMPSENTWEPDLTSPEGWEVIAVDAQ